MQDHYNKFGYNWHGPLDTRRFLLWPMCCMYWVLAWSKYYNKSVNCNCFIHILVPDSAWCHYVESNVCQLVGYCMLIEYLLAPITASFWVRNSQAVFRIWISWYFVWCVANLGLKCTIVKSCVNNKIWWCINTQQCLWTFCYFCATIYLVRSINSITTKHLLLIHHFHYELYLVHLSPWYILSS